MEQSEGSSEQAECSKEQTESSEQTEIPSEQSASEQTEHAEPLPVEHAECSSEQPECSSEQPECSSEQPECSSEQPECSSEQPECSSEQPECSSEQPECSSEQPECSSEQPPCSIEQTAPAEPAKDVEPLEEWSEPWLELFAEQLSCLPTLWRTSHAQCKAKSGRGFAYLRLMSAMGHTKGKGKGRWDGEVKARVMRAMALCKEFFRLLRQKMRSVALEYLDAGPDGALRHCPAWVRRADSYLHYMPSLFTILTTHRNIKRVAKKKGPAAPAASRPAAPPAAPPASPPASHPASPPTPPPPPPPPERLMRRVVRGMRRAAAAHGGLTRAAAAAAAERLGDPKEKVFALWCGMQKLSLFKLRALLIRGDAPSESGRLDALDWSIVDLLIMYEGITLVGEASYQNYEQLSALLGTFHLVQRFGLEGGGRRALASKWKEAARWYSRNRVQMSVLGLQKRWSELKMDTRRRLLARLRPGAREPDPLPLHQAIARRYEHVVVTQTEPHSWKWLVKQYRVGRPTSERGPGPGEPDARRTRADDDTSDSDTAAAAGGDDDDDDLTIVEKTLETIDLSEDIHDETDTNEVEVPLHKTEPESKVARSLPSLEAESSEKTNASRQLYKTIDVDKEIVDVDAPSPNSNVLEALQGLDVSNIETTILFDSDEEDDTNNVDNRASVNKNKESLDKCRQRESTDSEDGNLVIDCEDSNSAFDVRNANHNTVWKEIEKEMIPEQFDNWAGNSGYSQTHNIVVLANESTKESDNDETTEKYPLLSRMLQTKSVYDTLTAAGPKVYYNTKRYHAGKAPKQYANAKVVSVGKKDIKRGSDRSQVAVSELVSAARVAECGVELMSEEGGGADGQGESEGQQNEGTIDPKLLMYAVVVLRRIDEEIPQILSLKSTAPTPLSSSKPQNISRHSTPTLTRPSSRTNDVPEILSRQSTPTHPSSRVDEEPHMSEQSAPSQDLLCPRESLPPPPLNPPRAPTPHSQSLLHYYAANVRSKFLFLKRNIPLLKQCKPCSVVLRRVDLGDRAETVAMNRVAKKVELPDIEEVRRNNRSMLTAQVAPLAPRREGDCSSTEPPSCSSDSDWTPDAERPQAAEPHPAVPDSAEPDPAEPHSAEPLSGESADDGAETDGGSTSPGRGATSEDGGATSAELGQLLSDLLAEAGSSGECSHGNNSGGRGPLASTVESCAGCALRVLSAPPISGVEARLQRRVLRRLAKAPNQPTTTSVDTTATSTTVTTTTVTTIGSTVTVPTTTVATERKENSGKSRSKPASQKRRRPRSPPAPRARSPPDPEAAAREWLRQKNIAAEKFGIKPRSYKKAPPVVQMPEPPAVLQPLVTQVLPIEPPPLLKAMQATDQVPEQNQPIPRVNTFKIVMQEVAASTPPKDHSAQPFRITPSPANKTAQSSNSILLNQGNTSTPLLNQTNPVLSKNSAQMSTVSNHTQKKAFQILNHTPRILNEINATSIFNPNALADINKKLVTLAPATEPEAFEFSPVISNVHSLATPKTTSKKLDPNAKKVQKTQQNFIIIPASNPTGSTSILLRSQESDLVKPSENLFTSPQSSLPQVVNVTGGHIPSASIGQALHLVVSQSPQKSTGPMLTNIINQPNMVVSGNMIQNVQKQQVSVRPGYLVTSMPQLVQSQPLLVSCTSLATPTTACQPSVFSSLSSRPMVVRSVQAGPAGVSQNASQENSVSQDIVSQAIVTQQNVTSQRSPVQLALTKQNVAQHNLSQRQVVSQQNVSHQNPVSQQSAVSQHIPTEASLVQGPKVADEADDANEDSDPPPLEEMSPSLNWALGPTPAHLWALGRDSTALSVLCTGPRERPGWELGGHLLLAEEELPVARAAYWTISPRARLALPGEEPTSPVKRRKLEPDTSKSWLKVKAFARLAPEELQESQKDTQKESQKPVTAPARVFVNNTVYQKLSDDPLVYAKLLVAVRDARACRALLARGAALQFYCLRTGKLFPLQAEMNGDVSRVTLSGDEDVSGALVSLAKQLYKLPDSDPQTEEPVADADRQASMPEIKKTVEKVLDCIEPSESKPRPAKRPRESWPAERRIAPKLVTSPPCQPDVIELSDED